MSNTQAFAIPRPMTAPTATQAPVTPAPAPMTAPVSAPVTKEKKERTRSTVTISPEHILFVAQNIMKPNMDFATMAAELKISVHQVKQIVNTIKTDVRADAKAQAAKNNEVAYGKRPVKERGKDTKREMDDYDQPISTVAKNTEEYIKTYLSRPDSVRKGNPESKNTMKSVVDGILAKIGK